MKYTITVLTIGFFGFLLAACTNNNNEQKEIAHFSIDSMKKIIDANNVKYVEAFLKGDSAAFVDLHHIESLNMPPNAPILKGKGAMGSLVVGVPKMGIKTYKVVATEVIGGPLEFIEQGVYELEDNTKLLEKGKYMVIWKQENNV